MVIIVDTNVISEMLRQHHGNPNVIRWFIGLPADDCFTTTVTVAEMLYGLAIRPTGHKRDALTSAVLTFIEEFATRTVPFDAQAAPHYATIMADRKALGQPIGVQDAMIAAIARSRGAAVATRNVNDFVNTGVDIINPWSTHI